MTSETVRSVPSFVREGTFRSVRPGRAGCSSAAGSVNGSVRSGRLSSEPSNGSGKSEFRGSLSVRGVRFGIGRLGKSFAGTVRGLSVPAAGVSGSSSMNGSVSESSPVTSAAGVDGFVLAGLSGSKNDGAAWSFGADLVSGNSGTGFGRVPEPGVSGDGDGDESASNGLGSNNGTSSVDGDDCLAGTEMSGTGSGTNIAGGSSAVITAEVRSTVCAGFPVGKISEDFACTAVGGAADDFGLAGLD